MPDSAAHILLVAFSLLPSLSHAPCCASQLVCFQWLPWFGDGAVGVRQSLSVQDGQSAVSCWALRFWNRAVEDYARQCQALQDWRTLVAISHLKVRVSTVSMDSWGIRE